ncbi:hypothetical protein E2562_011665 [Oryza meyeriana var. granulata]|uniref:Uncharacterized protein n=1 Tax=Oryza meyeriana var. granulata TaxID=110450 RepID=A0A6G1DIW9_9ORYZ|nr:hypothetical protein E2562_011665 [Oryza meyeriana var. granulata]
MRFAMPKMNMSTAKQEQVENCFINLSPEEYHSEHQGPFALMSDQVEFLTQLLQEEQQWVDLARNKKEANFHNFQSQISDVMQKKKKERNGEER